MLAWLFVWGEHISQQVGKMPDEKRAALIIGNEGYLTNPLSNPLNDARAINDRLIELGFGTVLGQNLERDGFFQKLNEFEDKFWGCEVALLYYAGHGVQYAESNYFVSVEANIQRWGDIKRYCFPLDIVFERFKDATDSCILLLDCCRNTPFLNTMSSNRDLTPAPGLADVKSDLDAFVVFATAPNNVAKDGRGEHSPFTQALLDHLGQPGVEIYDTILDVMSDVQRATNSQQKPSILSNWSRQFFFIAPPTVSSESETENAAEAEFVAIMGSNSIAIFEAYILAHPGSNYIKYAQARIKELRARGAASEAKKGETASISDDFDDESFDEMAFDDAAFGDSGLVDLGFDDLGFDTTGSSKLEDNDDPPKPGSMPDVPKSDAVSRGAGKKSYADNNERGAPSKRKQDLHEMSYVSVAKVLDANAHAVGSAFVIRGADLFGEEDNELYIVTASFVLGSKWEYAIPPSEAHISFEESGSKRSTIIPVNNRVVWELSTAGDPAGGVNTTVAHLGTDLPDYVKPLPIAKRLPKIDYQAPLSMNHPGVIAVSFPYGGAVSISESILLDYDRGGGGPVSQPDPLGRETFLHYTAASEPGTSGCPILNHELQVIGLHIGGGDNIKRLNQLPGTYSVNFGVWIQSIIHAIRRSS